MNRAWSRCILSLFVLTACGNSDITLTLKEVKSVPPAGVRVTFSVQRDDGEPVSPLNSRDFEVINDVTGRSFLSEGGGTPFLAQTTDLKPYTILALDMSDSIFAKKRQAEVIAAAKGLVKSLVADPPERQKHQLALYAFGSTSESKLVHDFSADGDELATSLDEIASYDRGGTNLYGAYMMSLGHVREPRPEDPTVLRSVVLLTDGTHEAGDKDALERQALESLKQGGVNVYVVGIKGDYDEGTLKKLVNDSDNFFLVNDGEEILARFQQISEQLYNLINNTYVFGLCSPVERGSPSISITHKDAKEPLKVDYSVQEPGWTGNVSQCNPEAIAKEPPPP